MRILKKITDEFWWDVARKCDYATFYHTPIWREMALRVSGGGYRDETFGAILSNGVRVVFPMVSARRLGPIRWLASTFEGCYGGYIADGPVSPADALKLYQQSCTNFTYTFNMLENPIGPALPEAFKSQLTLLMQEITYTIHLDADFDTVFSRFQKTQRKDYRRGLKHGVKVRLANSINEYQSYYHIYRDAVDRWGGDNSYGYNWNVFEHIYDLSQSYPEQIKLWVMTVDEQIVGGTILFYWGIHTTAWNGTAHRDFLDYDVMPVGDTEMIRDAIERGFRYYDFNTSGANKGVITYKQRFGAEGIPIHIWRFENRLLKPTQKLYTLLATFRHKLGKMQV